ncbi:MAG: FISUMP domain-containing protein, partial [Flavobacteriaceae bacterium]|nr:FISUMP domain-containing protein [Flavobacteriaceae bacterium]
RTGLKSIDLTGQDQIKNLSFQDSPIESITNLKDYSELNMLIIDNTVENGGSLEELDITGSTKLTSLRISNQKLTVLDASKQYKGSFSINATNTLLSCIKVSQSFYDTNQWSNWTLEPTTSVSVDCSTATTYVPDDNFEQALIDLGYDSVLDNYVETSTINTLTELNISNKNINSIIGIEDFTSLEELQAYGNDFSDEDNSGLVFTNNKNLITLVLWGSKISKKLDLSQNKNLLTLNLNSNNLEKLDISNNNILTSLSTLQNSSLSCIQISEIQANSSVPSGWLKEEYQTYSTDCSFDGTYFTDPRDENVYKTINVNGKIWFAEDLRYDSELSYNPYYDEPQEGVFANVGMYYPDDEDAIPDGWRIPTKEEWVELFSHVGGSKFSGGNWYTGAANPLKSSNTNDWLSLCTGESNPGSDDIGFNAISYIWKYPNSFGSDYSSTDCNKDGRRQGVLWWSSTAYSSGGSIVWWSYHISFTSNQSGTTTSCSNDNSCGHILEYSSSKESSGNDGIAGRKMLRLVKED